MSGWVCLHRRTIRSEVFADPCLLKVWVWALCRANYKKVWVLASTGRGRTRIELQPGQFIFGRKSASVKLRMPEGTLYGRMKKLEQIGCISMQPNTHFTVVTICHWERYQMRRRKSQQATQHPSNTQPNTGEQVLLLRSNTKTRSTGSANADTEVPAGLLALIDTWNKIGSPITASGARRDPPSKEAIQAWNRAQREFPSDLKQTLADLPAIEAAIRKATFCHGQGWFSFPWLFTKNDKREWHLEVLLRGGYARNGNGHHATASPTRVHQRSNDAYCN